jgi:hypothetical protein
MWEEVIAQECLIVAFQAIPTSGICAQTRPASEWQQGKEEERDNSNVMEWYTECLPCLEVLQRPFYFLGWARWAGV